MNKKPEGMTHFYGNTLISKDSAVVVLRGKLDTFQALLIEAQMQIPNYKQALNEVAELCLYLMKHEVLNDPMPVVTLFSRSLDELHEMSHNPKKHFNLSPMLLPSSDNREAVVLNKLRAQARELELAAVAAFKVENGFSREDLLFIYNRLSSAVHVLMYQALSEK